MCFAPIFFFFFLAKEWIPDRMASFYWLSDLPGLVLPFDEDAVPSYNQGCKHLDYRAFHISIISVLNQQKTVDDSNEKESSSLGCLSVDISVVNAPLQSTHKYTTAPDLTTWYVPLRKVSQLMKVLRPRPFWVWLKSENTRTYFERPKTKVGMTAIAALVTAGNITLSPLFADIKVWIGILLP